MNKLSIYTRIAREIERDQSYNAMCKSFPLSLMTNISIKDIMVECKNSESVSIDILIPNWNDDQVQTKLREIINTKTTGVIFNRLLSNLKERLNKFLQNIENVDIPAIKPTIFVDANKIYTITISYSFMDITQTISQSLYTSIQKRIGSCQNLILTIFWISLRYSIIHSDRQKRELAIISSRPLFEDIEDVLHVSKSPPRIRRHSVGASTAKSMA